MLTQADKAADLGEEEEVVDLIAGLVG